MSDAHYILHAHNTETMTEGVPVMLSLRSDSQPVDAGSWHIATEEERTAYDAYLSDFRTKREDRHAPRRKEAVDALIVAEFADDAEKFVFTEDELREILASAYNAGAGI